MYSMPGNFTGLVGLWMWADSIVEGWFSTLFVISMILIMFINFRLRGYKNSDSASTSMLIAFVLCALIWGAGILPVKTLMIVFVLMLISVLYAWLDE